MGNGLNIEPPPKKTAPGAEHQPEKGRAKPARIAKVPTKFDQVAQGEKVQFNKRVNRATADGFDMLAITTRRKVPDLLDEALDLLKARYGKI